MQLLLGRVAKMQPEMAPMIVQRLASLGVVRQCLSSWQELERHVDEALLFLFSDEEDVSQDAQMFQQGPGHSLPGLHGAPGHSSGRLQTDGCQRTACPDWPEPRADAAFGNPCPGGTGTREIGARVEPFSAQQQRRQHISTAEWEPASSSWAIAGSDWEAASGASAGRRSGNTPSAVTLLAPVARKPTPSDASPSSVSAAAASAPASGKKRSDAAGGAVGGGVCAVWGLEQFLAELSLSEYLPGAAAWVKRMGAAYLEEVAENCEDLAESLPLKPLERKRLCRQAEALAAKLAAHRPTGESPPGNPVSWSGQLVPLATTALPALAATAGAKLAADSAPRRGYAPPPALGQHPDTLRRQPLALADEPGAGGASAPLPAAIPTPAQWR